MLDLSVVIPVFDERPNLRKLHRELCQALSSYQDRVEFLFVDDGSTDGSREELARLAEEDPRLSAIRLRRNFGQTAAMQAGIDAATGDVIVLLDGDLQNDPADIPLLVAKLEEGFDLVCGWRRDRQDVWLTRRIPSQAANWLIARVTGVSVHDLGCSLKVLRRSLADELELVGEMHRFIPILAHRRGARCAEVVTHHRARQFGRSKYGLSRIVRVLLDLVTVKFLLDYLTSPIKFFGKLGLACWGCGLAALGATILMKFWSQIDMTGNPLLLLSVLSVMAGVQLISMGVLGELNTRIYFDRHGRRPYAVGEVIGRDPADDEVVRLRKAG